MIGFVVPATSTGECPFLRIDLQRGSRLRRDGMEGSHNAKKSLRWNHTSKFHFFGCRRFGFCGIAEVKDRTSPAGFNPLKILANIRVSRNDRMSTPVERGF